MSWVRERFVRNDDDDWKQIDLPALVEIEDEPSCPGGACPSDERGPKLTKIVYGGGTRAGKREKS